MILYYIDTAFAWGAGIAAATSLLSAPVLLIAKFTAYRSSRLASVLEIVFEVSMALLFAFIIGGLFTGSEVDSHIMQHGKKTTAKLLNIKPSGRSRSGSQHLKLELEVSMPEGGTFRTLADASIPINEPELYYKIGQQIDVTVDSIKKGKVLVSPPALIKH